MIIYTVQSGDTLGNIARRFGISPLRIAADNQLRDPSKLVVGQNLLIMANTIRYILEEGQTLYSLSQEYGVPLEDLLEANPNLNPISLRAGDEVRIPAAEVTAKRPAIVNGYAYSTISTNAVNCVMPFLSFISIFSYSITPEGGLVAPDDSDLIYRSVRAAVMPLMVVTNIYNGTFDTEVLSGILNDPERRERLISGILEEMQERGYYGANIDMEYIAPEDRESYNSFLQELADRLHEQGYIIVSALAPKVSADQQGLLYESHDYEAQGRIVDYIILMTYEWGYT